MTDQTERRAGGGFSPAGSGRLAGVAAVFNTATRIGDFNETILPGAFRDSLAGGADILLLVDHDQSKVLARTANGSLSLRETAEGLTFEAQLPGTTLARDIRALAEAGTLGGMSFGFRVRKGGESWPSRDSRELRSVDLLEISVVQAFPAYPTTSVAARSREAAAAAAGATAALLRRRELEAL